MKKLYLSIITLVVALGLIACNNTSDLNVVWDSISADIPSEISDDFTAPTVSEDYADVTLTWSSDNQDLLNNDGTVTQPLFDTSVVVTFVLDNGESNISKTATVTVLGIGAAARVDLAKTAIDVSNLTENLDFSAIEAMYGVVISITSADQEIVSNSGTIYPTGIDNDCDLTVLVTDETDTTVSQTFTLTATVKALGDQAQVDYVLSQINGFTNVTDDLVLVSGIQDYLPVITWSSGNTDVLTDSGVLTQPVNSVDVTMTATVTLNDVTETKTVTASVAGYTDQQKVLAAQAAYTFALTTATSDITFDTETLYGVTINWSSNEANIAVVGGIGYVTRPGLTESDVPVVLTAEFVLGNSSELTDFSVVVPHYTYQSYSFTEPNNLVASLDTAIDLTAANLHFVLDDDTELDVAVTAEMLDADSFSETGEQVVTVSYLDITETFTVEVFATIENVALAIGESVSENFDDVYNPSLSFDNAQVPNSMLVDEANGALSGNAMYFESAGAYACLFINGGVEYEAGATYKITFDYNLSAFIDTLYFQLNGGASGNLFTQFGSLEQIGTWQEFSYTVTLADTSDYLIQIFPGGGSGVTSMVIDNIKIERVTNEPAKTVSGEIAVGDYIFESFGDTANAPFTLDLAPTPNSAIIDEANGSINGMSLYFESAGSYTGIYLNENFAYTANATYRITFDYKVTELADTIYFQLNGGAAGNLFTQFGSVDTVGTLETFTWDVTLADTTDYIIQIFPGGAAATTSVTIDNIRIERLSSEPLKTVSGEIPEGDYVLDSFGDSANAPFTLDLANTPSSMIVTDSALDGSALYLELPGVYTSVYINENFSYTAAATYTISFDYLITALEDTIYFQLNGGAEGNLFTQFGLPGEVDTIQTFTWQVTLGNSSDYLIQIFPGGGSGSTTLYIDNLRVERVAPEVSTTVSGELAVDEFVFQSFGDPSNEPFTLDLSPTANSTVVTESPLDGSALYLESPGSYTTIYLNENFTYTANATYRITFDYDLVSLQDTIYFQLTGPAGNLFTQFGLPGEVDTITTFSWDVTLGDSSDYIIQIFPGGTSGTTSLYIDNLKVERIG